MKWHDYLVETACKTLFECEKLKKQLKESKEETEKIKKMYVEARDKNESYELRISALKDCDNH